MAKKSAAAKSGGIKNFEERLQRLQELGEQIRKTDMPLDEALKAFEEGIILARSLETELGKIERRIEILMNPEEAHGGEPPDMELFNAGK
jgi:exodeoxyribonuclease VII small subunit